MVLHSLIKMEEYFIHQWYMTPVWVVNAANFGYQAYKNFKEYKQDGKKLGYAAFWALSSVSAVGLTSICAKDGLEKLL